MALKHKNITKLNRAIIKHQKKCLRKVNIKVHRQIMVLAHHPERDRQHALRTVFAGEHARHVFGEHSPLVLAAVVESRFDLGADKLGVHSNLGNEDNQSVRFYYFWIKMEFEKEFS